MTCFGEMFIARSLWREQMWTYQWFAGTLAANILSWRLDQFTETPVEWKMSCCTKAHFSDSPLFWRSNSHFSLVPNPPPFKVSFSNRQILFIYFFYLYFFFFFTFPSVCYISTSINTDDGSVHKLWLDSLDFIATLKWCYWCNRL